MLPDEFIGVDVTGRHLQPRRLARERFRHGLTRSAIASAPSPSGSMRQNEQPHRPRRRLDARRRPCRRRAPPATRPESRRPSQRPVCCARSASTDSGSLGICVSGFLAMLWEEVRAYEDEFWGLPRRAVGLVITVNRENPHMPSALDARPDPKHAFENGLNPPRLQSRLRPRRSSSTQPPANRNGARARRIGRRDAKDAEDFWIPMERQTSDLTVQQEECSFGARLSSAAPTTR